eukprot:Transcript_16985.p1 GENE.Transcript_16985~~Transcript_16985.p1  ORF type:complete len:639 (-),score=228.90 Transcript_16985:220-2136(-)
MISALSLAPHGFASMPDQDSTCSFDFTPLEKITATLNKASMEGPYDPALNPTPICDSEKSKNVILLIGDGFGWEPTRAGAITIEVLKELEEMGIPATGTTDATKAAAAKAAFAGRTLDDYYTKGRGHGMAHQDLDTFTLMTTSTVLPSGPVSPTETDRGTYNVYAYASSMRGPVSEVAGKEGQPLVGERNLLEDDHGMPLEFDVKDIDENGMYVGWIQEKGCYPWQAADIVTGRKTAAEAECPGFDENYRHNHATDSANTATAMATGYKVGNNMMAVDLYENFVPTLVEEAMACGKAGGVMSSVPILHATPGAFITHAAYRKSDVMNVQTNKIDPTLAMGGCASRYQPSDEHKDRLAAKGTFFSQQVGTSGETLLNGMSSLDPDDGAKVVACTINAYNMPYRGIDSSYSGRHGADGDVNTRDMTDHYDAETVASVPKMKTQCEKAIEFMGKADHGFFLMMEQGDIDWALHGNHMDDMLGTILDFNDCIETFKEWIHNNGGWEKNALYVTADHDHFLHLEQNYPEVLANMVIDGNSHHMTPDWHVGPSGGLHGDVDAPTQQWTDETVAAVGHFHALRGQHNWNGHTNMPVPLYAAGDDGCIPMQRGRGLKVIGKEIPGTPGYLDQVHLHECMRKQLFGY